MIGRLKKPVPIPVKIYVRVMAGSPTLAGFAPFKDADGIKPKAWWEIGREHVMARPFLKPDGRVYFRIHSMDCDPEKDPNFIFFDPYTGRLSGYFLPEEGGEKIGLDAEDIYQVWPGGPIGLMRVCSLAVGAEKLYECYNNVPN